MVALCIAAYTLGRAWIESLRVDDVNHILGLRLNVWTSIIVFLTAAAFLIVTRRPAHQSPDTPPAPDAEKHRVSETETKR